MMRERRKFNVWFPIFAVITLMCLIMTVRLESYIEKDNKKAEINQTLVLEKINTVSELCVTELSFREVMKFEKGSIPIINKNKFTMVYSAKAKLGFDLSETEIKVENEKITIKLPEPKITSIEIDEDSIEFYDEANSLFGTNQKQDMTQALQEAKKDVSEKAVNELNLDRAVQDAQRVIYKMLEPVDNSESYTIEFIQ